MPASLAERGLSRADLWAFAAIVAVEWGLDRNNAACAGSDWTGPTAGGRCGHLRAGRPDCETHPHRPVEFLTGRADCRAGSSLERAWMTDREEIQPNAQVSFVVSAALHCAAPGSGAGDRGLLS